MKLDHTSILFQNLNGNKGTFLLFFYYDCFFFITFFNFIPSKIPNNLDYFELNFLRPLMKGNQNLKVLMIYLTSSRLKY